MPTDKDAYNLLTRIRQWAVRFRNFEGGPIPPEILRSYLLMANIICTPELEHRIFVEQGKEGAWTRAERERLQKLRERKEKEEKRQFPLPLNDNNKGDRSNGRPFYV